MLARLAQKLGYDLLPRGKVKHPQAQLQLILERGGFDAVIDVGANTGQYAERLREWGWHGPIVSFEPLPEAHASLTAAAAGDAGWTVAPRVALGAAEGTATLEISAESDMSSLLAQNELLARISPSSAVTGRVEVPVTRLDRVPLVERSDWRRLFLKLDVQGYEPQVIEGAASLWPRIHGIQVELAVLPVYEGEVGWQAMVARLSDLGFEPHLFIPGYFSRSLARLVQMDGVFLRRQEAAPLAVS